MMSITIKSLLLGILMGFVAIGGSIAHAQQIGILRENTADHGKLFAATTTEGVEVIDQVHAEETSAVAHEGKRWLKGRKMVVEDVVLMKNDAMKGGSVKGGKGASEMNSGATHSVGNCDHQREGELNVETKMTIERLLLSRAKMVGKDRNALEKLFGTSQIGMKYQNVGHATKTIRNSNPYPFVSSETSSAVKSSTSYESHRPPVEAIEAEEKLLKDALETMHMLTMDYRQKPRRKPPINNAHPLGAKTSNP
ncbi:hypothetical protein ACLOJK_035230 [Asimina triloba]